MLKYFRIRSEFCCQIHVLYKLYGVIVIDTVESDSLGSLTSILSKVYLLSLKRQFHEIFDAVFSHDSDKIESKIHEIKHICM